MSASFTRSFIDWLAGFTADEEKHRVNLLYLHF